MLLSWILQNVMIDKRKRNVSLKVSEVQSRAAERFHGRGDKCCMDYTKNAKQRRHAKGQTKSLLIVAKSNENRISIV